MDIIFDLVYYFIDFSLVKVIKNSHPIKVCRLCNSKNIYPLINLGNQPLANSLKKEYDSSEDYYPLEICQCNNCSVIQLTETVNANILFDKYVWLTGISEEAKEYSEIFYKRCLRFLEGKENFIVEIASNDGTFLKPFKKNGFRVLGIDPAKNISEIANQNGIKTINEFFGTKSAEQIICKDGHASLIFARNVIPHVENVKDVIEGIKNLLDNKGVGVIEFHRADIILKELHYDSIYHEHLFYFSIFSLSKLLNNYGLYPFDLDVSPISGGSFVIYFSKEKKPKTIFLLNSERSELDLGVEKFDRWKEFSQNVIDHKNKLNNIILDFARKKHKLIAYGASARSSTLLNYCNIKNKYINIIADKSPLKNNLFTPGSSIKIVHPQEALKDNPEVILLLAWNFKNEIISELRNIYKWSGKIILPLPNEPQVIDI